MSFARIFGKLASARKSILHREIDAGLSGGEIKRIEIASALARGAQLTIFDEPEAGIDLWSFQDLIQVFQSLRSKAKPCSFSHIRSAFYPLQMRFLSHKAAASCPSIRRMCFAQIAPGAP